MKQNFYINKFEGQLGNQILTYNNLCQLAYLNGKASITEKNEISKFFKNINTHEKNKNGLIINANSILNNINYDNEKNIILTPPFLGECFFKLTKIDPRNFLQIKDEYLYYFNNNKTNIAIHLRMPAVIKNYEEWKKKNPYKAKKHEYFNNYNFIQNSIEYCIKEYENCNFVIFGASNSEHFSIQEDRETHRTMDKFSLYENVINYLKKQKYCFELSITLNDNSKSYFYDFSQMSQCDVIIANPSTFNTCATFLGKHNKKVIYEKNFLKIASENALFWKYLNKGGNEFYKIDVLI